jgi:hypothetical protein
MFRGLFICVIDSPREYSTCFIIVSFENMLHLDCAKNKYNIIYHHYAKS